MTDYDKELLKIKKRKKISLVIGLLLAVPIIIGLILIPGINFILLDMQENPIWWREAILGIIMLIGILLCLFGLSSTG